MKKDYGFGTKPVIQSTPFSPRPFQKEVIDRITKSGKPLPSMNWGPMRYHIGIDPASPGGDKTVVSVMARRSGKTKTSTLIWVDEMSNFPVYKWYRNPIKWYKWKRIWKKISKQVKEI